MKKYIGSISIFILLIVLSCDDISEEVFCECKDPLKNLEWLNELYLSAKNEKYHDAVFYKVIYLDQEGFIVNPAVENIDSNYTIYDCAGNVICSYGRYTTCVDLEDKISYKEIFWSEE